MIFFRRKSCHTILVELLSLLEYSFFFSQFYYHSSPWENYRIWTFAKWKYNILFWRILSEKSTCKAQDTFFWQFWFSRRSLEQLRRKPIQHEFPSGWNCCILHKRSCPWKGLPSKNLSSQDWLSSHVWTK